MHTTVPAGQLRRLHCISSWCQTSLSCATSTPCSSPSCLQRQVQRILRSGSGCSCNSGSADSEEL